MAVDLHTAAVNANCAVLVFTGWPDAGKLMDYTFQELRRILPSQLATVWNMDGFWHIEAVRPNITVQHGQIQRIDWPSYQFFAAGDGDSPSLLLGIGPEPTTNWRLFSEELLQRLKNWGCRQVILLGSLYDQIFHDEVVISAVVQDHTSFNKVHELGCQLIEYSGPSAIHSIVMKTAEEMNILCLSIWAHLPFYLSGPNELITANLLNVLGGLLNVVFDTKELLQSWQERQKQIDEIVRQDQNLRDALETMKRQKVMQSSSSFKAKIVRFEDFKKRHKSEPPEDA